MYSTHGYTGTRTYSIWKCMRQRCRNPNKDAFVWYGGRGITICPKWDSFECFLEDMGEAPKGKSLDRIDNNRGYYKDNCRWATPMQQMHNCRTNLNFTYKGETHCATEWARRVGLTVQCLLQRIKRGFSLHDALFTPSRKRKYREIREAKAS